MSGDDARNAYFTVEALVSDEKAGAVIGGGIYQYGQFAKLQAIPEEEYVFEGWYRKGILLSKEEDYRIQILSDESITAKFVKKADTKSGKTFKDEICIRWKDKKSRRYCTLMVMATEYLPIIIRYRIRQEERRLVSTM